ncbi:hypothetical protein [Paenibacillus sp. GCM10028914]
MRIEVKNPDASRILHTGFNDLYRWRMPQANSIRKLFDDLFKDHLEL